MKMPTNIKCKGQETITRDEASGSFVGNQQMDFWCDPLVELYKYKKEKKKIDSMDNWNIDNADVWMSVIVHTDITDTDTQNVSRFIIGA